MADDPLTGFAIGSLAAGRGATALAELSALIFQPPAGAQPASGIDVEGVLRAAREADAYIQKLERAIEALQQENSELRAKLARAESDRDKLNTWADWAEAELGRRSKGS